MFTSVLHTKCSGYGNWAAFLKVCKVGPIQSSAIIFLLGFKLNILWDSQMVEHGRCIGNSFGKCVHVLHIGHMVLCGLFGHTVFEKNVCFLSHFHSLASFSPSQSQCGMTRPDGLLLNPVKPLPSFQIAAHMIWCDWTVLGKTQAVDFQLLVLLLQTMCGPGLLVDLTGWAPDWSNGPSGGRAELEGAVGSEALHETWEGNNDGRLCIWSSATSLNGWQQRLRGEWCPWWSTVSEVEWCQRSSSEVQQHPNNNYLCHAGSWHYVRGGAGMSEARKLRSLKSHISRSDQQRTAAVPVPAPSLDPTENQHIWEPKIWFLTGTK